MGTTGIVYAKSFSKSMEVEINSVALNVVENLNVKVPITLHIFKEQCHDMFEENTIL